MIQLSRRNDTMKPRKEKIPVVRIVYNLLGTAGTGWIQLCVSILPRGTFSEGSDFGCKTRVIAVKT